MAGYIVTRLILLAFLNAILNLEQTSSLTILNGPKNAQVKLGDSVELPCVFDQEVNCFWFYDFDPFCMNNSNVQYAIQNSSSTNGTSPMRSKDCSLKILIFKPSEIGRWFCRGKSVNSENVAISEIAFITVQIEDFELKLEQGPEDMNVSVGDNITIPCVFNYPVTCRWYVHDTYSETLFEPLLIKVNEDPERQIGNVERKDCSLNFQVKPFHFWRWRCEGIFYTTDRIYTELYDSPFILRSSPAILYEMSNSSSNSTTDIQLVEISQNMTVEVGNNFRLICIFSEPVNCKWIFGLTTMTHKAFSVYSRDFKRDPNRNCSFNAGSATDEDSGLWQCRGTLGNKVIYSSPIRITIGSSDSNLTIIQNPQDTEFNQNESVTLSCIFNLRPFLCYWYRNNKPLRLYYKFSGNGGGMSHPCRSCKKSWRPNSGNCSLTISAVSLRDIGEYQCVGFYGTSTEMSTKVKLTLKRNETSDSLLKIIEEPTGGKFYYHESVSFTCIFNQPTECHWIKEGNNSCSSYISGNYSISNGRTRCQYVIKELQKSDLGAYRCWANSNGTGKIAESSNAAISAYDNVYIGIEMQPSNTTAYISRYVSLSCVFNTTVDCYWLHNGSLVDFVDGEYTSYTFYYSYRNRKSKILRSSKRCSFSISTLRSDDIGLWQCKGVFNHTGDMALSNIVKINTYTKSSKPVIIVENNKHFIKNPLNQYIISNEDFDIKCISEGGNPAPDLNWYINDKMYLGISHVTQIDDLFSTEIKWNHSIPLPGKVNKLFCKLSSNYRFSSYHSWMDEKLEDSIILYNKDTVYAGVLKISDQNKNIFENDSVAFTCIFNITVNCQWVHEGRLPYAPGCNYDYQFLVNCGYETMDCSINLTSVKLDDAGQWICKGMYGFKKYIMANPVNLTITRLKPINEPTIYSQSSGDSRINVGLLVALIIVSIILVGFVAAVVLFWLKNHKLIQISQHEMKSLVTESNN